MTVHDPVHDMATSAYLSQQGPPSNGPGAGAGEQEADGVMNLVNTNTSQGYTLPREQVVGSTLKRRFLSSSIQHPTPDTVTAAVKIIYPASDKTRANGRISNQIDSLISKTNTPAPKPQD